jgi:hypothetical protein
MDPKKPPEIQIERVSQDIYRITVKRQDGTFQWLLRVAPKDEDEKDTDVQRGRGLPTLQPA